MAIVKGDNNYKKNGGRPPESVGLTDKKLKIALLDVSTEGKLSRGKLQELANRHGIHVDAKTIKNYRDDPD